MYLHICGDGTLGPHRDSAPGSRILGLAGTLAVTGLTWHEAETPTPLSLRRGPNPRLDPEKCPWRHMPLAQVAENQCPEA